jgi:leader peptidase (prepilin peptidase)/N-methyltransferase
MLPLLAVAGAVIGRFLLRGIERFPTTESLPEQLRLLRNPLPYCVYEGHPGTFATRLPVVGWIMSLGRCAECRRRLPRTTLVVELATAILFPLVYWLQIPSNIDALVSDSILYSSEGPRGPEAIENLWSPVVWLHLRYLLHMLMICGLIVATAIDFRFRIIPDGSTVPVMIFAVLFSFAIGQTFVVPLWFQDPSVARTLQPLLPETLQPLIFNWDALPFAQASPHWHGLLVSLAGLVAGAGSVWLVRLVGFWVLKQEAMGFGDVVLMAMIGSVLGWQPVIAVFFIAPMLAVFAASAMWLTKRDREIPYGPWLSFAAIMLLLTWTSSWPLIKRVFDMGPILILMAIMMIASLALILQFVQIVKRLFGISPVSYEDEDLWTSADHLTYYGRERPDEQTGQWPRDQWPGSRAGRGLSASHHWRHPR